MKDKKISIKWIYFQNLIMFLTFALAIKLMNARLEIWYIFLVLLVQSTFETVFFYKTSDKSFEPISYDKSIQVFLLAIASTVVLVGSILFIIFILR